MTRSRLHVSLVGIVVALVIVSSAAAQPPDGGGRGGFRGRPPGPPRGMDKNSLLRAQPVIDELAITTDQQEQIRKVMDESRDKGREMFSGLRDASDAQRQAMRSQFEKLAADTDAKVTGILSEAQNKRLGEIAVQVQGAHVLLDKKIAEQLQLTDAQTQSINDLVEAEREEQMGRFADLRDLPQDERRAKFEQLRNEGEEARKATDELILAELSTEQAEQFKAMAGEPFEFDRNELFRGMFAGPGGPGGPRGEGGPRGQRGGRGEGRPNRPSNE